MATSAFNKWVQDGRFWRDARPIAETKVLLKAAHPHTVVGSPALTRTQGGIQTDDSHLHASPPLDHTPYSADAWPDPLPGYVVCAIDYMDNTGGLDCGALFTRWLADCKAGRRPWTKYLIWQGKSYSVRNDWVAQDADGHFDHIHESVRTDWIEKSIGSYNPFGAARLPEDDMRLIIAKEKGDARVYVGNGVTRRHIANQNDLSNLQHWLKKRGYTADEIEVHEFNPGTLDGVLGALLRD
ncbi:hypothetical protein O7635_07820 [Asanoa sp. WMMD1127]|uniref:hypothetical protein n=1 Tax=Asanoa sp. WMMD1127 TaxID=3016107 RepID=UPI0024167381|nr:hypothetical protein [Asanoa sp. WMMD1127]MDG4821758.1 hypothetical protein [Asanoa sp. WMMD1127]